MTTTIDSALASTSVPPTVRMPEQSNLQGGDQSLTEIQSAGVTALRDPVLDTLAAGLDDIEATCIAQSNRVRILTSIEPDEDGKMRGHELPDDHPAVVQLKVQADVLKSLDDDMAKLLAKQLRKHALYPWVKSQHGLGDKTIARLLAAIQDPYWNDLYDRPRTIGELFSFCGVAGPGMRRQRGVKVTWNPDARKRLWIIATTIVKVGGPFREVYDDARMRYVDKLHTVPCVQCGKKGQPAEVGTPWRDGHKHAGAVRIVMREVLRGLWTEAKAVHEAAK